MIVYEDFAKIDVRIGTVLTAEDFPQARKPAYKLGIDFGAEIGIKKSSAQITENYSKDALIGRQVLAVVNLPPRQIGTFMSEVLVLGVADSEGRIVLLSVGENVPNGAKMF